MTTPKSDITPTHLSTGSNSSSNLIFQPAFVPQYDILLENSHFPKKEYIVIIPVINEGERIKSLLKKMNSIKIQEIASIVIVDGGSRDGSLEHDFLTSMNVHTLLLKKEAGKLSMQLLCAYHYALSQSYKGIITIDGNDKDDPSSIFSMIEKLQEGYDFIQASRFLPGGVGIRTPLSRLLAIKLLHAPILSASSGFKWTDTTQGFRAYSPTLLSDPRLHLFRPIFRDYELLAYLSHRAPQLQFRCLEIPTSRIYPTGEVPTKISSIRGNLNLLKVLIKVALNHYND